MIEILLCTLIWGASFVAQKLGADHFGPFSMTCYRNLLAVVFLWVCVLVRDRFASRTKSGLGATRRGGGWTRSAVVGGALSGVCVFAAELTQQFGIERTSPGVSAFLTANYVLLVPVFGILLGRRAGLSIWGGVALALLGTYFICLPSSGSSLFPFPSSLGSGEAWTLLCAALFAVQIMVVDRFAGGCDMLRFSVVQMGVAGLVCLPFVFLPGELARASWEGFVSGIPALLFLGVLSSGIAYTLQNLGQAKVPAALASIIMSLEGTFAALFGWLILGDVLSPRQLLGCALVFGAVILSQVCNRSATEI
ncbi:MAG: EamA family transporter [Kiritimatiellae bacterium]|nr:EamA family transporter [Kiritimatiellia bacterium]